jgi:hypothetical protein
MIVPDFARPLRVGRFDRLKHRTPALHLNGVALTVVKPNGLHMIKMGERPS